MDFGIQRSGLAHKIDIGFFGALIDDNV
jgi:hypothetical protein